MCLFGCLNSYFKQSSPRNEFKQSSPRKRGSIFTWIPAQAGMIALFKNDVISNLFRNLLNYLQEILKQVQDDFFYFIRKILFWLIKLSGYIFSEYRYSCYIYPIGFLTCLASTPFEGSPSRKDQLLQNMPSSSDL